MFSNKEIAELSMKHYDSLPRFIRDLYKEYGDGHPKVLVAMEFYDMRKKKK